jgi:hypothetical protein
VCVLGKSNSEVVVDVEEADKDVVVLIQCKDARPMRTDIMISKYKN